MYENFSSLVWEPHDRHGLLRYMAHLGERRKVMITRGWPMTVILMIEVNKLFMCIPDATDNEEIRAQIGERLGALERAGEHEAVAVYRRHLAV